MNSFFTLEEWVDTEKQVKKYEREADDYRDEIWNAVVKRLLYLCRIKKININTLAFQAGLTPSTLKSILYGKSRNPGIVTLARLCDGLSISMEEFFQSKLFKR